MGMESGLIVIVMLAGVGGGGVPICSVALLFNVPTVAVIFTYVFTGFALNLKIAAPVGFVVAVAAGENDPVAGSLTAKNTVTPLMGPAASVTSAVTVVLAPDAMVEEARETRTEVGVLVGVPMVIGALPLIVVPLTVTAARMVADAFIAAAVNVAVATPDAFVTAVKGVQLPEAALITEKETVTLGTGTAEAPVTVAVTVADPPGLIAEDESVTFTVVAVPDPAPGPEDEGGFILSTPHPPKLTNKRKAMTKKIGMRVFSIVRPPCICNRDFPNYHSGARSNIARKAGEVNSNMLNYGSSCP